MPATIHGLEDYTVEAYIEHCRIGGIHRYGRNQRLLIWHRIRVRQVREWLPGEAGIDTKQQLCAGIRGLSGIQQR